MNKHEQSMNREAWMTNREKKRAPKRGLFWCWGCDAHMVAEGQKCKRCGVRDARRRNKK